jgi:hypothetical protein
VTPSRTSTVDVIAARTIPVRDDPARRYLNAGLRPLQPGIWPWAVLVYGDTDTDEIASTVSQSLRRAGRDTVTLFRDGATEQTVATDLFRGNASIAAELELAKYCTRILVGRVSALSLGSTDGLTIARASVTFRLLDADGRVLKDLEISEKGGGLTEEAAIARAVDELRAVLPERLSEIM